MRRLAAADLHQIRLALACAPAFPASPSTSASVRLTRLLRRRIRKADRAGEIAFVVDLDQREAGMLLVIGA